MENLILSLKVVTPFFLLMAVGYGAKRFGLLNDSLVTDINRLLFRVFYPVLMFRNAYQSDLASVDFRIILFAVVVSALSAVALYWVYGKIEPLGARRSVLVQCSFRGNEMVFGLSVALSMLGADEGAMVTIVIAALIPLFNVMTVCVLQSASLEGIKAKEVLKTIITNPLIVGIFVGLVFNYFQIKIPALIYGVLTDMTGVASPMAFVLMGATFAFSKIVGNKKLIAIASLIKLILLPAVWIAAAALLLGWRGANIVALLALYASPAAASSYAMANALGGDAELASELIVATAVLAVPTTVAWIFVLKTLGLV